ncbi:adenosine receptor A1-like [Oculina patagonica]
MDNDNRKHEHKRNNYKYVQLSISGDSKNRSRNTLCFFCKSKLAMAAWETVLFTIFNCLSLVIGSCANFLVIVSSLMFISVRDIEGTSFFLVSLSVADFLLCAVYQPLMVIRFNHPDQTQSYLLSMSFFGYSLMTASLNGLLAVSFDRFVVIYLPFKYITWMNETNVALLISISWVVALAIGILNLSNNFGAKVIAHLYTTIIIVVVPILYGVIYKEARKQARRIIDQSMPATMQFPNRHHLTDRATRGIGLVLITTLVCWLPMILFPAFSSTLKSNEDILRAVLWCLTASCVNSCINPFIYFYKFSKFRRNVRKLFQKIKRNVCGCFPVNRRSDRVNPIAQDPQQMETSRRVAWTMDEATTG